jgi:hypothetical protein
MSQPETTPTKTAYGIQLRTDIQQVFIDHPLLVTLVDAQPSLVHLRINLSHLPLPRDVCQRRPPHAQHT